MEDNRGLTVSNNHQRIMSKTVHFDINERLTLDGKDVRKDYCCWMFVIET